MNDDQLLRYSRHILLDEIGVEGQERISNGRALIVGAGGLGSPVALYLASAGVGTLALADHDTVDLTNLQRQIMHTTASVGTPKVASGAAAIARINAETKVETIQSRLEGTALDAEVARADVVLDCTDNFATRHAINHACVRHRKPLVSGAGVRFDGQLSVFDTRRAESPCYACLFPEHAETEELRCAVLGVFAPVTGIIGTMQAAEALKVLAGVGEPAIGRLVMLDALTMDVRTVRFKRDPACAVCANR
jgi:molybdopterin-synthase adenylyltransferase